MSILFYHHIKVVYMYAATKMCRKDTKVTYFQNRKVKFVDIDDALEIMSRIKHLRETSDYGEIENANKWLEVLNKVKEDTIVFGDKIPDTSDVFGKGSTKYEVSKTAKGEESKQKRQRDFVKEWNKIILGAENVK